jgi:hypothetical protein
VTAVLSAPIIHRPASKYEPLALLLAVRRIAEESGVEVPQEISTRCWDRARDRSDDFGDAPAARRICEHLRLSWGKVRELAFLTGHRQRVAFGHAMSDVTADWLTFEYGAFVLQLVARRLSVPTLTPVAYRAERRRMLTGRKRQVAPGRDLPLPTAEQLETLAGTWDDALAQAGLASRQGVGGHRARVRPVPIVDVLDRCYASHGTEPTLRELELFARANGIPFPRKQCGRPYSDYLRQWKDARIERGLAVPHGPPPREERPDYSRDAGAATPNERRAKRTWTDHDEVVAWVARYLLQADGHRPTSQRAYDSWARDQGGAPWASVLQRHGGWVAVREEAWQRLEDQAAALER